jgi:DNA-binding SARP family transcriptional activator
MQNRKLDRSLSYLKEAKRCFNDDGREMESAWSAVWLAAAESQAGETVAARECIRKAVPNPYQISHAAVVAARQSREWLGGLRKDAELRSSLRVLFDKVDRLDEQLPPLRRLLRRLAHTMEMPTPSLIIKAFGAGQVWANGQLLGPKDWQTQAVRELFFYFLYSPRPVGREQLAATLWPETDDPSRAKTRFRNEIYRLRRAVGFETILFDGGEYYQFNKTVDHEYDVEAFDAYLRKARAASKTAEKTDFYERALELVQGKYLEDMTGSWIVSEQQRLQQAFLDASAELAELYVQEGQAAKAVPAGERALLQDATCEPLSRALMRAHARLGDKASIARVYQRCREAIRNEFNMEPSPETQELFRKLAP